MLQTDIHSEKTAEERYSASSDYILREISGETVLVSVGNGIADFCGIVRLNQSAKLLWQTLQKGAGKEELTAVLTEAFAVTREQAAEDVDNVLRMLLDRGMISRD